MKWLILATVAMAACQLPDYDDYQDKVYNIPAIEYEDHTVQGIALWVARWVTYTSDKVQYGEREEWATPEQTYWSRKGDCEDYVLLLMYLLHRDLGLSPRMVIGKLYGNGHGWVDIGGEWWEATWGYRIIDRTGYDKDKSLSYSDALGIAHEARGVALGPID
jgi:hypothetical protein